MDDKVMMYLKLFTNAMKDENFRKVMNVKSFLEMCEKVHVQTTGLHIAILGYKITSVGQWDPFNVNKGLPGSEECTVYASQELANRGHRVTVYMDPPSDSLWQCKLSNPQWLSSDYWNDINNTESYDLVLMWRRFDLDTGRKRGKIVFFWGHDSPPVVAPGKSYLPYPKFDGNLLLSNHHKNQFNIWPEFDKVPYVISGNGILLEQFLNPMNITNPYSIGYFSNYSRGLIILLLIWPDIIKEFPTATLDICYGRQTWGTCNPEIFNLIISKIEEYKSLGVTEHGMIGHQDLANIMQRTSVLSYPCTTHGETFCITAVKCQAAGCIPVTTRIGALNETLHPDTPSCKNFTCEADILLYKELLLNTLRRIRDGNPEDIKRERLKYIEFGKQFTWKRCVDLWLDLYNKIKK